MIIYYIPPSLEPSEKLPRDLPLSVPDTLQFSPFSYRRRMSCHPWPPVASTREGFNLTENHLSLRVLSLFPPSRAALLALVVLDPVPPLPFCERRLLRASRRCSKRWSKATMARI